MSIYTSGGVEKVPENKEKKKETGVAAVINTRRSEAVIKRNEDGTSTVVYPDSDEEEIVQGPTVMGEETPVIKGQSMTRRNLIVELLDIAAQPSIPNIRHASTLESQWLQKLVDKYGDDYDKMMWDKELNPMQHTSAQLTRKIKKWRETTA